MQVTFLHALLEIAQERVMRDVAIPTTLAIQHWQHHALRRRVHVGKRHGKCNKLNKLTCRVERDFCNKLTCRVERSSVTLLPDR